MSAVNKEQLLSAFAKNVSQIAWQVPDDTTPQLMAYKLGVIAGMAKTVDAFLKADGQDGSSDDEEHG